MNDPTRLRIDIDVNEETNALTIEVWAMIEKHDNGSSWDRIVRREVPSPIVIAGDK